MISVLFLALLPLAPVEPSDGLLAVHKVYVAPLVMQVEGKGEEFRSALRKAVSGAGFEAAESDKDADAVLSAIEPIETRVYWNGARVLTTMFILRSSKDQTLWRFSTSPSLNFTGGCTDGSSEVAACADVVVHALTLGIEKARAQLALQPAKAAGLVLVYVVREMDKSQGTLSLLLDGKEVAQLPASRYLPLALRPGKRHLAIKECKGADLDLALSVNQDTHVLGPDRAGRGRLRVVDSRKASELLELLAPLSPFIENSSQ